MVNKKTLKILKKLPRVQVGTILNIFWTNGSYEKPSNPITKQDIEDNFISLAVKIDWHDKDTGTVTLKGEFNYLIYKKGEYFFLTPLRPIDINKKEFVYSVTRDLTMTMLCNSKYEITGTLVKTLDRDLLIKELDSTKSLIEDYDENIVIPVDSTKDKVSLTKTSYRPINLETFTKVKCFSTKKLAWILEHLTQRDTNAKFAEFLKQTEGPTKLFFACEFDELIPQSKILNLINEWLRKGSIAYGYLTDKNTAFASYSCDAKMKELLQGWTKVSVLFNVNPVTSKLQDTYLVQPEEIQGEGIPENYFDDINEIIPLDPTSLEPYKLNNRHIFDMLEDAVVTENASQWDSYYELRPRAYTELENFLTNNEGVLAKPFEYGISIEELDKIGHLTEDRKDQTEEGESIVNSIKSSYYPDWWHGKSWTRDALERIQDSIQNKNPVVGFILYEIYNYWQHTRGADKDYRYFNMYTKESPLNQIELVTGLRLYSEKDNVELDLLATYNGDKQLVKSDDKKKINYGFITGVESRLLKSGIDVFIMYSFLHEGVNISSINKEFAKEFKGSFVVLSKTEDVEVPDYVVSTQSFDLTKAEVPGTASDIDDVTNKELLEHCWTNYNKVRDLSTIRTPIVLHNSVKKGDLFWSNTSWVFHNKISNETLNINKSVFAMLLTHNKDLTGKYEVRFSTINAIDLKPSLNTENNIISTDDEIQQDKTGTLYPWLLHEENHKLEAFQKTFSAVDNKAFNERIEVSKKMLTELWTYYEKKRYMADRFNVSKVLSITAGGAPFVGYWSLFYTLNRWFLTDFSWNKGDDADVYDITEHVIEYMNSNKKSHILLQTFEPFPKIFWTGTSWGFENYAESYYQDRLVFKDTDKNKSVGYVRYGFEVEMNNLEKFMEDGNNFINNFVTRWNENEKKYINQIYKLSPFSETDIEGNLISLFAPSDKGYTKFNELTKRTGFNTVFKEDSSNRGCLSLSLKTIYKNTEQILLTTDKLDCYWTDITLKDIKKTADEKNKLWVFKLSKRTGAVELIKGYALIQWDKVKKVPLIQILITDDRSIKVKDTHMTTPKASLITNQNIYQCINQKNYFYAWGQKIPIKAKLVRPYVTTPIEIYDRPISAQDVGFEKHALKIVTPREIIDTKISVPKRQFALERPNTSYLELERLKLDTAENSKNRSLDIAAATEKARILDEKLQNEKDELAFQNAIGPYNILSNVLSSTAKITRFYSPNEKTLANSNIAAGMLGASMIAGIGVGITNYLHASTVGEREVAQMDKANSFTIAHDKAILDNKHHHEAQREKLKLLELTSNYSDWNPGDDEELKNYNKMLFGNENINFGFIHYRPKEGGVLIQYIINYYARYGVDLYLHNHVLKMGDIINQDLAIWQFDSISNINILDFEHSEKIRKLFTNGLRFRKVKYYFEKPKVASDELYILKEEFDKVREARTNDILILAQANVDEELKEAVRVSKENLDAVNDAYNDLKDEETRLTARVEELEAQIAAGGCPKSVTDELEKYKNSASFLSEQKMALEEEKTSLTNQLALEKRKVEACNQQVVNAGTKNLDLVKKLATANAAKKTAETARDAIMREHQECESNLELVKVQLDDEKREHEMCKQGGKDEDAIFNDYVDRIEALIEQMTEVWKIIIRQINDRNDKYTYLQMNFTNQDKGYQYDTDAEIVVTYEMVYLSLKNGGVVWIDNNKIQRKTWEFCNSTVVLYKNNTVNGGIGYVYDNFVYHPGWCLLKHVKLLINGNYTGFKIRYIQWERHGDEDYPVIGEYAFDSIFLSSVAGQILCSHYGLFLGYHKEYIKLCKQFKQWETITDYLNKKKIPILLDGGWDGHFTKTKQANFNKAVYFNTEHISSNM